MFRRRRYFGSSEPSARLVAQRIFITRLIYRAVLQGTAWMWPSMEMDLRALPDKRLEWHVRLKEGRPCPLYFELSALIVAALPRQIGLPNARVAAEVDGRHGIYRIELPSSEELEDEDDGSTVANLWHGLHTETHVQFTAPGRKPNAPRTDSMVEQRLCTARTEWSLTGRQTDVFEVRRRRQREQGGCHGARVRRGNGGSARDSHFEKGRGDEPRAAHLAVLEALNSSYSRLCGAGGAPTTPNGGGSLST